MLEEKYSRVASLIEAGNLLKDFTVPGEDRLDIG